MNENNRSNMKATRYAIAYNKILKMIKDGLYPEGSKLPTEPLLAEQLGISRSTLRQALALLQEDGILEARKGIGNFVRKTLNVDNVGIERMENPFYKSCIDPIDNVGIKMGIEVTSEHTERIFNRKIPVVLAIYRYYKEKDLIKGSCFSHVATDFDHIHSIDLNNQNEVLDFLENKIYDFGLSSMLEIKIVPTTENIKEANQGNPSKYYQMIIESISDNRGNVIAYNKYYIPFERAIFKVFRKN
ncbi:MAG: GntR family transcriptional regulator [Paenibacillus sp.]|uniref:GntR family transcriptional regulator n=1 Tax=Paenibacillus sp. TaxID=58172 RepID=UPI0025D8CD32|nr:GntR family transcriptional regulator [Paenibacillus sp.]MBR2565187.1 GntR family transcriptional regulator [Paenibacillus sp.]